MSKAFIAGSTVGAILLITAVVGVSRLTHKQGSADKRLSSEGANAVAIMTATPVVLGMMSADEREHSKLFSYPDMWTIQELIDQNHGEGCFVGAGPPLIPISANADLEQTYFENVARNTDVIVRGEVMDYRFQVTDDQRFLFTDYEICLDEIYENRSPLELQEGSSIVVSRPGGKVIVDGVKVTASDASYYSLPLDAEVVLSLKYIPQTQSFATRTPQG